MWSNPCELALTIASKWESSQESQLSSALSPASFTDLIVCHFYSAFLPLALTLGVSLHVHPAAVMMRSTITSGV